MLGVGLIISVTLTGWQQRIQDRIQKLVADACGWCSLDADEPMGCAAGT